MPWKRSKSRHINGTPRHREYSNWSGANTNLDSFTNNTVRSMSHFSFDWLRFRTFCSLSGFSWPWKWGKRKGTWRGHNARQGDSVNKFVISKCQRDKNGNGSCSWQLGLAGNWQRCQTRNALASCHMRCLPYVAYLQLWWEFAYAADTRIPIIWCANYET